MVLKTKRQAYVLEAGNLCTWMMIVTKNFEKREPRLLRIYLNAEKLTFD